MALAFNSMAAHYENLIQDLRKMVEVIKKLAAGDFSVRLETTNPDSEVTHVAASFNQMAQTFGEIVGQLRELGISLATSATQITAASKQQELVITEQESTTREISVTANQISTTAQEFAETMNEVSQVADETAKLAGTGKKSLQHMEQIMGQMVQAAQSIASKLAVLNEKASNITSVITTITKVADQTNLLSLNASIEAEKAGEYGKSFAVIAKEIRRLADLTANATLDIEKIVTEIMTAVSTSVTGMDDFTHEIKEGTEEVGSVAEQLNTIMEQVQVLTSRFESINDGMQAQAIGAEQINDAISQLNMSARETSSSLSGFRQTLQGLTVAAGDLKSAVDRIKKENLMENLSLYAQETED
jgi:methyl-accepting chemotaxis protein